MNADDAARSHLRLLAFLRELPPGTEVEVSVHDLLRDEFDRLPGEQEACFATCWNKTFREGDVRVELWTMEPPPVKVMYPAGRDGLRLVQGGAA